MSALRVLMYLAFVVSLPLVVAPRAAADQTDPAAIPDGSGGMIVAWEEAGGGAANIYVKALDGAGNARWPTVLVCGATGDQLNATIVSDGAGGAIVAWQDARDGATDIYAQRVLSSGVVDPEWPADGRALCVATGSQTNPTGVSDGAGGVIVAWQDNRGGSFDIYAQRVLAGGGVDPAWPADGRALCSTTGSQVAPAIVTDGSGGAIVTWFDDRSGNLDIYAGRVRADGTVDPVWPADGAALSTAAGDQREPAIAADGTGGAIVTWADTRNGPHDIYAQHVLANGVADPAWPANGRALCTATGTQSGSLIVGDGAGGAIAAWYDLRTGTGDIYAQRVLASGAVDAAWPSDGRALCTATAQQLYPAIVADGTGGALVAWQDQRSGNRDIYAQRVLSTGVVDPAWPADGRALCGALGEQFFNPATIVSDSRGGAIVTWEDRRDVSPLLYAARVTATGVEQPEWTVDGVVLCSAAGDQDHPLIVADGLGGAIVTWTDYRSPISDIYAQRVLASGGVDPAWPADGRALCTATGDQYGGMMVPDGAGGAIVTWEDYRSGDYDIYAQRILASGAVDPAWPPNGRAVCTAAGWQQYSAIIADGAGGAIVTWADSRIGGSDIYAQRVLTSGTVDPGWPADGRALCTAAGAQYFPTIIPDGAGGAIVTWYDWRGSDWDIYAQRVLSSGAVDPDWPANGRALCTATGFQYSPTIAPDGGGGAIVAWTDGRIVTPNIYAQRVLASGVVHPAWPADGRALYTATGAQTYPTIVPDGAGGAIVTWQEVRDGDRIYAQRVLASGSTDPVWPVGGLALCTATSPSSTGANVATCSQHYPTTVADGTGGAIVAWVDGRNGNADIYAQRITRSGPLAVLWTPDGVTPTLLSLQSAEAGPDAVRLTWHTSQAGLEATLYRSKENHGWTVLATLTPDGVGRVRYVDQAVLAGSRYGYRLGVRSDAVETYLGEVWVLVPSGTTLALEGSRPNPATRDLVVAFSLPHAGDATLELLDVAGRRVITRHLTGPAGNHLLNLDADRPLAAGVYVIRLTQAGYTVTCKAVVAR